MIIDDNFVCPFLSILIQLFADIHRLQISIF